MRCAFLVGFLLFAPTAHALDVPRLAGRVVDLGGVERLVAVEEGSNEVRRQVLGAHVAEHALLGAAHRRPHGIDDDGVLHAPASLAAG